jgi:hypothetical protein
MKRPFVEALPLADREEVVLVSVVRDDHDSGVNAPAVDAHAQPSRSAQEKA